MSLRVFGNGTVFYTMRRHLILNCEGDLPIFPFDSPMCDFNVESSKYPVQDVPIVHKTATICKSIDCKSLVLRDVNIIVTTLRMIRN